MIKHQGEKYIERKTKFTRKKGTNVSLFEKKGKNSYKIGDMSYGSFRGNDHEITLKSKPCIRTIPIRQETWNYWMSTAPSYHELQNYGKGKKTQIKAFLNAQDINKAHSHIRDMIVDLGEIPILNVNYRFEMK